MVALGVSFVAYCDGLRNVTVINGSDVDFISPYCDPCLRRAYGPRPFNHTSLRLLDNATLHVTIPAVAAVVNRAANLTVPHAAVCSTRAATDGKRRRGDGRRRGADGRRGDRARRAANGAGAVGGRPPAQHRARAAAGRSRRRRPRAPLPATAAPTTRSTSSCTATWVPNVTATSQAGRDLIAGLSSAQTEPNGWNAIRAQLGAAPTRSRSSAPSKTRAAGAPPRPPLRLPRVRHPRGGAVHITVPGSALVSQRAIEATPAVPVYPVGGAGYLSGTCDGVREESIRRSPSARSTSSSSLTRGATASSSTAWATSWCADCTRWRSRAGGTRRASE